jgi:SAM-dependent methyltransferase
MFVAKPQVDLKHYDISHYNSNEAWMNFWYQINFTIKSGAKSVLEIGPGNKTVTIMLQKAGLEVTTVDIDPALKPDFVASVTEMPFEDNKFDTIICSEVLEHLPYDNFLTSLKELKRISKKTVILGLPNAGAVLRLDIKLPILPRFTMFGKIPFFWKEHKFNGEHYWETGKKGYSRKRIRNDINNTGFIIKKDIINSDDPAHWLMILEKV